MQRNLAPKTPLKPESDEENQNCIPALEPPAQDISGNFVQNNGRSEKPSKEPSEEKREPLDPSGGMIGVVAPGESQIHENDGPQSEKNGEIFEENVKTREISSLPLGSDGVSNGEEIQNTGQKRNEPQSLSGSLEVEEMEKVMKEMMEAVERYNEQFDTVGKMDTVVLLERIHDARRVIERWKSLVNPWVGTERYGAIEGTVAAVDRFLQSFDVAEENLKIFEQATEEDVPSSQNENKTVFPSALAQKQIDELKDLLSRQNEHLTTLTLPENPVHGSVVEPISDQIQRAQQTLDALKQIRATHVKIKNCLAHDLPKQPVEAVCLEYWKTISEIDMELAKIDDEIAKISLLASTPQNGSSKISPVPEIKMSTGEPTVHQKRTRSLSPRMPKFAVAIGRGNRIKSRLRPPLPLIEEEDAPEKPYVQSDENESVTAIEKPQNVFVKAVHAVEGDENENDEEFVNEDSESDEALETPQDVLTKMMNSCNSLIQEQEKCFRLWRSEANPDYETERLVGALEELHTELKSHRDLLTENLGRALAKKFRPN